MTIRRTSWPAATALVGLLVACGGGEPAAVPGPDATTAPPAADAAPAFAEAAMERGLRFVHDAGAAGAFAYPEIMGPGGALADLDGDGDLDAYLVQGGRVPGTDAGPTARDRLFENDGTGRFVDVTETALPERTDFGQGVLVFDADGDGDRDLLVTNVGPVVLLANRGDGTFEDATERAGLAALGALDADGRRTYWQSAALLDLEGDGDLDVYVTAYTRWKAGDDGDCPSPAGLPDYCHPRAYAGAPDALLRNEGDGTFVDVSVAAGIAARPARAMGVVATDVDGDGRDDLFVACDAEANLLWINRGDGTFVDEAILRGVAVNGAGTAESSMGIAVADLDRDGDEELYVTHLVRETHTLYRNDGGIYTDATAALGLATWSVPDTGFGVGFLDHGLDGTLDLHVANGGVARDPEAIDPDRPWDDVDRFVRGTADGRFRDGGPASAEGHLGRGAAYGDVDGDGDVDVLVAANRGPTRLLLAAGPPPDAAWIGIRADAGPANRDGIGATITLLEPAGANAGRAVRLRPGGSYLSSSEPVARFGLGPSPAALVAVEVRWPNGTRERFDGLLPGDVRAVRRGAGDPLEGDA